MKEDVRSLIEELKRRIEAGEVTRKEVESELKRPRGRPRKKPVTWALMTMSVGFGHLQSAIKEIVENVPNLPQAQAEIGELSHQLANQHLLGKPKVTYRERIAKIQCKFQNPDTKEPYSKETIDRSHRNYAVYWEHSKKLNKK